MSALFDLNRLEALAKEATPGPWHAYETVDAAEMFVIDPRGFFSNGIVCGPTYEKRNVEFIAAASPDVVAALVAEVRRLTRWKDEAKTVMSGLQELGTALGLQWGSVITGPDAIAAVEELKKEIATAKAEGAREALTALYAEIRHEAAEFPVGYDLTATILTVIAAKVEGAETLPVGLCGNRADHEPHRVDAAPVAGGGAFWCCADQGKRLPYSLECH